LWEGRCPQARSCESCTAERGGWLRRRILYDLTELENAGRFKKGETERTAKKVENVNKWFVKLDADLANLLSYFV
tara:strand:+ start:112 stop:336 length:225 start_codon:yes stop_codon:yes gene_type:complete